MEIQITSNAAESAARLEKIPGAMVEGIARALDRENQLSIGHIQAKKLSKRGPTTLGVASNRLRSSPNAIPAGLTGGDIVSAIGSNVEYAAAHEFGVDRMVAIPAHMRRRFETQSGGSSFNPKTGKIRKSKPKRVQTGEYLVRTHSRHMKLPARAPFATGVEERRANYTASISAAVLAGWEGKNS